MAPTEQVSIRLSNVDEQPLRDAVGSDGELVLGTLCSASCDRIWRVWSLEYEDDGGHLNTLGWLSLHHVDPRHRSGRVALVLAASTEALREDDPDRLYRRLIKALTIAVDRSIDELNLHRIETVAIVDSPWCNVADACGFVLEGTLRRQFFQHGRYADAHVYGRLVTDRDT